MAGNTFSKPFQTKRVVLNRDGSEPGSGITRSHVTAPILDTQPMNAVTRPEWTWTRGQIIVVSFLDGTPEQHDFVKQCFREYDVNLTFDFVDAGKREKSHVRITVSGGGGFRSLVGTQAIEIGKNDATMWLCLKHWREGPSLRGKILHEGLHMLGFEHEHSSPNCRIKWIPLEVYQYYKKMHGWNRKKTRRNVLGRLQAHQVDASKYDPDSIMHYEVDPTLTQDRFGVPENLELSEMDKKMLKWMYGSKL